VLFIKSDVYNYLLEYEHSILAYYTKSPINHYKYLDLVGRNYNKINVLSNYAFYVKKLSTFDGVTTIDFSDEVERVVDGWEDPFISSSPCILPYQDGYLLNVRYVNYRILDNGSYYFRNPVQKIATLNKTYMLNKDLTVRSERWIDKVEREELRYQGIEDVKVFEHGSTLLFLGTIQHPVTGSLCIGHGTYELTGDCLHSTPFKSPQDRDCEKNWCYFHDSADDLRIVYDWMPLTTGRIANGELELLTSDRSVPAFFSDVRGSSNGFRVGGELWFLCHIANYTVPRTYYHLLVVLDGTTLALKRHSILFKFNDESIEYALGLVVETDRLLISYSRYDRTSAVMIVPRSVVEKELFPAA
jgi:hypothetical protein